ncbi:MAG TPA: ribose-phosphate pyrophosphokinase [Patescibacteria group bacterium]|nr:ribose-phosphate pyrophosphokinase [Patescibacteria group bacterium]
MKIFSGSSNRPLAEKVAQNLNLKLSPLEIHKFPDGEKRVRVSDVLEDDVVLIQSTGIPVDENYMELFLILDSLKRSGARSITLVAPYFGYQRQDHMFREGEDVSFKVIVQILESFKVDKVITFDLHSIKIPEFFHIPVVHLTALDLFTERPLDKNMVLVSPDMGGIRRIKYLSEKTGLSFATIEKNRDLKTGKVESSKIEGDVKGKNVAIVDDMISTGGTIRAAVELLKKNGAKRINVFATHAVLAGDASSILENLDVEKVYVTDTIDTPQDKKFSKLEILSVADLIAKELK